MDDRFDRADAEAAGRDQDRRAVRLEAVLPPQRLLVAGYGEHGSMGIPETVIVRRESQPREVHARLLERHEVAVDVAVQPHPMNIEVGHDDRQPCAEPPPGLEPGDDFGRQEVRAYRPGGIVALDQLDERSGVELIQRQPPALVLPGFVQVIVEQTQRLGRVLTRSI